MGRLIEESRVVEILQRTWLNGTIAHRFIDDIKQKIRVEVPTVEAIPKDQYEARLKADLKAILVELQLGIEELDSRAGYGGNGMPTFATDYIRKRKVNELIQQKIDALKGDEDGKID